MTSARRISTTRLHHRTTTRPSFTRLVMSGRIWLHAAVELAQKVHQGDACADPAQLERRLDRAVAAAHYDHALLPVGVRLHEEVRHVREILPRDAERVG